jgi:hypothetical protein
MANECEPAEEENRGSIPLGSAIPHKFFNGFIIVSHSFRER